MNELDDLIREEEYLVETIILFAKRLETVRNRKEAILGARAREPPEKFQSNERIQFDDSSRSVSWENGRLWFTTHGKRAYRLLKMVYQAGIEGIEHQEVAERLFGDELAGIKSPLQSARSVCEKFDFPWLIENENDKLYLTRR